MTAPTAVPTDQAVAPDPDLSAAKKAAGIADRPSTDAAPATGGLPGFRVECLGGGRAVSLAQLRGPTRVNVGASWCTGCREEAPFLAEASRIGSGVSVTGVDHADGTVAGRHAGPFTSSAQLADESADLRMVHP